MRHIIAAVYAAAAVFVAAAPVALAHGGAEHVMGTIKAADDASVVVKSNGRDIKVELTADTVYEGAANSKDLKAGQRVVVHAKKDGKELKATLVKTDVASKPVPEQHPSGEHHH